MATSYRDLNGGEDPGVRSKQYSRSFKEPMGQRPSAFASNDHADEPAVRKKTFSSSINQFPNHYPGTKQFLPHTEQPKYSTSEQVQYLISQNFELLQEIREIKGFAGLINSINSKVEYLIQESNHVREVTDALSYDFNRFKSRLSIDDEVEEEEEYSVSDDETEQQQSRPSTEPTFEHSSNNKIGTRPVETEPQEIEESPHEVEETHRLSISQQRQNKPIPRRINDDTSDDDDEPTESGELTTKNTLAERRSSFKPDPSPTVEIPRPILTHRGGSKDNDDSTNPENQGKEAVFLIDGRSYTSEGKDSFMLKDPVKKEKRIVSSDTMTSRRYKCRLTDKSEDNRLQTCDNETETEPENQTEYSGDVEEIKPKEDKFLEELALSENFKARDCIDSKSNGADTVICIDTSASMEGEPFKQAVEFMNQFVDYIESWTTEYSIEENIAIVHFGREARIVQQLTNDYNKVRDAIENLSVGGPSPMMTGLVIAMSALFNRGGPVTVLDRQVNPRVILISDGNATDHRIFDGPDALHPNGLQWNMIKDKLVDFAERVKLENRHIISVPVGANQCLETLKPLAEITGGYVSSLNSVRQLSRSFFVEVMISKTRNEGIHDEIKNNRQEIAAIARSCPNGQDLTEEEMNNVITKVIEETEEEIEIQRLREQQQNEIDEESEMEVGLRVRRGPSWEWGDQDGFGTGTVIGHKSRGYVKVKWDCGNVGRYRHGAQNAHDLLVVDEPRMLPDDEFIAEGVYVQRGKDWEWDDQDGGVGSVGCVYKRDDEGIVHVRWESGIRGNYRFGGYGKMDLEVINPQEYGNIKRQREKDKESATSRPSFVDGSRRSLQTDGLLENSGNVEEPLLPTGETPPVTPLRKSENVDTETSKSLNDSGHEADSETQKPNKDSPPVVPKGVWQYKMNGDWINYPESDSDRIEKLFTTKQQGTVIVKLDGGSYRVTPHKKKQKRVDSKDEQPIRRLIDE